MYDPCHCHLLFVVRNVFCYRLCLYQEAVPFAVIGSNTVIEVRGRKMRGRMYPWGVVEIENPEHCDFLKLRTLLVLVILSAFILFRTQAYVL